MSKYFVGNNVGTTLPLEDSSSIYCLATSLPFTNQSKIDQVIGTVLTDQNLKNFKILDDEETILSQAENFTFVNTINMGGGAGFILRKRTDLEIAKHIHSTLSYTLAASTWSSDGKYSFVSTYPNDAWDLEVEPSNACTKEQLSAWQKAMIVGNSTQNILTAMGKIPMVDIPVILKITEK